MKTTGASVDQVKAARLTTDYDTRFGATSGPWTTDMFVEAVYATADKTNYVILSNLNLKEAPPI